MAKRKPLFSPPPPPTHPVYKITIKRPTGKDDIFIAKIITFS